VFKLTDKFIAELKWHLRHGLKGGDVHIDTKKVISELPFSIANKRISPHMPTCWELLYHMVFWHKPMIAVIKDDKTTFDTNYKKANDLPKEPADEKLFEKYKARFLSELDLVAKLIESTDLTKPAKLWNNALKYKIFQIILQHNSYHLAQIIHNLKILGIKIR
jgi:hypothetical protein